MIKTLNNNLRCILHISLYVTLLVCFVSCTKAEDDTTGENSDVQISFISPTEGMTYAIGDTIKINASGSSTNDIHGYDISIRKANDPSVTYYFNHVHYHNKTVTIQDKWKTLLTSPTNLEVEITLYLDHSNTTTKKSKVRIVVQ